MASHNANGIGIWNSDTSRGASSGRYRSRQHTRGTNKRTAFPDNISNSVNGQIYNEEQHSQEVGAVASVDDGSVSSNASKPRRGRGFGGPPRNMFRRQSESNQHFAGENQNQTSTSSRNDSNYVHNQPLNHQSRINQFSQDESRFQQTQHVHLSKIQTENPQALSRMGMLRDPVANI